jgi:3-phenylpropionate/trans-cinnamate dioxygenase ferredoxin subunit
MRWIDACALDEVDAEDALRLDHGGQTYALYHTDEGELFCTDGLCTHDECHLAGGLLEGTLIECPLNLCLFDVRDGTAKRGPATRRLGTHPVRLAGQRIEVGLPD